MAEAWGRGAFGYRMSHGVCELGRGTSEMGESRPATLGARSILEKKKQNEKRRKKKEVSWNRKRLEAREQMRWPRQSFLQWYLSVARFRDTAGGGLSLPEPGHQFGGGSSSYNGRTRGRGSSLPISGPRGQ